MGQRGWRSWNGLCVRPRLVRLALVLLVLDHHLRADLSYLTLEDRELLRNNGGAYRFSTCTSFVLVCEPLASANLHTVKARSTSLLLTTLRLVQMGISTS